MKERILEFLRIENRSSAQFAEEIGVQPSSISHIISGRNNPSLDFVIKMLTKYPDISSDWLLFGKGQM
jgi:plasmid maintenance system antidote protein VapI